MGGSKCICTFINHVFYLIYLRQNYYKTLMEYFAYLNLFKPKQKDPQVTLFFIFDLPQ